MISRDDESSEGIDNIIRNTKENIYENRTKMIRQNDKLQERLVQNRKFSSTPSLLTSSNDSLRKEFFTSSPTGQRKIRSARSKTELIDGVPNSAV